MNSYNDSNLSIWGSFTSKENSGIYKTLSINYLTPFNIELSLNSTNKDFYKNAKITNAKILFYRNNFGLSYSTDINNSYSSDKAISINYHNSNNLVFELTNRSVSDTFLGTDIFGNVVTNYTLKNNIQYFSLTKYFMYQYTYILGLSIIGEFNYNNIIDTITGYGSDNSLSRYSFKIIFGYLL